MKNIILSIVLGVLCISCCSNKYTTANLSGKWEIENVLGNKITSYEEEVPFLEFNNTEARLNGYTGCNRFFGDIKTTAEKNDISFSNIGSTKRLCADMSTEDAILLALSQVASVEYDAEKMTLKDNIGNTLMELVNKTK